MADVALRPARTQPESALRGKVLFVLCGELSGLAHALHSACASLGGPGGALVALWDGSRLRDPEGRPFAPVQPVPQGDPLGEAALAAARAAGGGAFWAVGRAPSWETLGLALPLLWRFKEERPQRPGGLLLLSASESEGGAPADRTVRAWVRLALEAEIGETAVLLTVEGGGGERAEARALAPFAREAWARAILGGGMRDEPAFARIRARIHEADAGGAHALLEKVLLARAGELLLGSARTGEAPSEGAVRAGPLPRTWELLQEHKKKLSDEAPRILRSLLDELGRADGKRAFRGLLARSLAELAGEGELRAWPALAGEVRMLAAERAARLRLEELASTAAPSPPAGGPGARGSSGAPATKAEPVAEAAAPPPTLYGPQRSRNASAQPEPGGPQGGDSARAGRGLRRALEGALWGAVFTSLIGFIASVILQSPLWLLAGIVFGGLLGALIVAASRDAHRLPGGAPRPAAENDAEPPLLPPARAEGGTAAGVGRWKELEGALAAWEEELRDVLLRLAAAEAPARVEDGAVEEAARRLWLTFRAELRSGAGPAEAERKLLDTARRAAREAFPRLPPGVRSSLLQSAAPAETERDSPEAANTVFEVLCGAVGAAAGEDRAAWPEAPFDGRIEYVRLEGGS